ncbi:MAG: hypothetical protein ABIJ40_12890 [Bacteroidota bacterium]
MDKNELLHITKISKKGNVYTIRGTIDFNIVKCILVQNKVFKRKNPPMFLIKLYVSGNYKGKKLLLDTSKSKYVFEEIIDAREEYYLPVGVYGSVEILKIMT